MSYKFSLHSCLAYVNCAFSSGTTQCLHWLCHVLQVDYLLLHLSHRKVHDDPKGS